MEKKLLDLISEYVNYEVNEATAKQFGLPPGRSKDDIAAEYGQALRELVTQPLRF